MTPAILEDKIKDFLENILIDITLKNKHGEYVPINIFVGDIPPKNIMKDIFPYVFIKTLGGKDTDDGSTTSIKLVVGTTSTYKQTDTPEEKIEENQTSHRDVLHIIQKVRKEIFNIRIIGGFPMEFPLDYKFLEDDLGEVFIAVLNLNFKMVQPEFEM